MKNILISSNKSGGGKTTFTICFMRALNKIGYKVQGYKTGPDYIDTKFHSLITGIDSRNLDSILMSKDDMMKEFSKSKGDINVIEGVMGFYDGLGADTSGSAFNLSNDFDLPVVLVLSPKAQLMSFTAELKGMLEFKKNNIIGIVLNNITPSYFELIKECIEPELDVKIYGFMSSLKELKLESRHLGLVQGSEIENLMYKIDLGADEILKNVDVEAILKDIQSFKDIPSITSCKEKKNKILNCGVALDKAFSFYYRDNLDLLEEHFNIRYFSPMNDKELPKDIDFLYIGGGYPEVFKKELSENKTMLDSIKKALDQGLPCYAECGGLMYLTESIEDFKTVGFFKGHSQMTNKLQNFGYCVGKCTSGFLNGVEFKGHEFHKSTVTLDEEKRSEVYKLTAKDRKWECGYEKQNTYGQYAHIHFSTSPQLLSKILELSTAYHQNYSQK